MPCRDCITITATTSLQTLVHTSRTFVERVFKCRRHRRRSLSLYGLSHSANVCAFIEDATVNGVPYIAIVVVVLRARVHYMCVFEVDKTYDMYAGCGVRFSVRASSFDAPSLHSSASQSHVGQSKTFVRSFVVQTKRKNAGGSW